MPKKIIKKEDKTRNQAGWFLNCHHHCGCRFRTDGKFVWCSGVWCDYIISKKRFDKIYQYIPETGVFVHITA